jgi:hypothetical protein
MVCVAVKAWKGAAVLQHELRRRLAGRRLAPLRRHRRIGNRLLSDRVKAAKVHEPGDRILGVFLGLAPDRKEAVGAEVGFPAHERQYQPRDARLPSLDVDDVGVVGEHFEGFCLRVPQLERDEVAGLLVDDEAGGDVFLHGGRTLRLPVAA